MIIIRSREKLSFLLIAFLIATVNPALATADDTNLSLNSRPVTLVYETTHNPPRALGLGTTIDWNKPGLTLELLRLVSQRLGIEFIYKRLPWKRGLDLLEKNKVDGIFHASYKKSRESIGVYPKINDNPEENRAIFLQSYVLYKLNQSAVEIVGGKIIPATADIGVINDYSIAGDLRKKGYKVQEANTLEVNFNKLVKGRIAAFATLENMADDYLNRNRNKYSNIVKVKPALKTKPYYLLFSRSFVNQNPELAELIWNTLAEVKASITFKEIIARY